MQAVLKGKIFPEGHVAYDAGNTQNPVEWFDEYCPAVPRLAEVAKKVLSLPPTSSGGERNWSAFKNVWTERRNRLLMGRAGILVYIHYNQRVLSRMHEQHCAADFEGFLNYLDGMDPLPGTDDNAASLAEISAAIEGSIAAEEAEEEEAAAKQPIKPIVLE